jgi:hypothetical protein
VAFVQAGIGMGGETEPENNLSSSGLAAWQAAGYSPATWMATVEQISTMYRQDFTATPVAAMLTSTFLGGDHGITWTDYKQLLAWYTDASPPWFLQNNALSPTSSLPDPTLWAQASQLALEQGAAAGNGQSLAAEGNVVSGLDAGYMLVYRSDIDRASCSGALDALASMTGST